MWDGGSERGEVETADGVIGEDNVEEAMSRGRGGGVLLVFSVHVVDDPIYKNVSY